MICDMREFEIKPGLKKILGKILTKDRNTYGPIEKKITEILNANNIEHYKNLRYNLKDLKRVHIGNFVLVFSYDKANDVVSLEDYDHHDNIYKH